jgi:hypothetical protein
VVAPIPAADKVERDQAVRYDVTGRWPMDGVAAVQPLEISKAAQEGLY